MSPRERGINWKKTELLSSGYYANRSVWQVLRGRKFRGWQRPITVVLAQRRPHKELSVIQRAVSREARRRNDSLIQWQLASLELNPAEHLTFWYVRARRLVRLVWNENSNSFLPSLPQIPRRPVDLLFLISDQVIYAKKFSTDLDDLKPTFYAYLLILSQWWISPQPLRIRTLIPLRDFPRIDENDGCKRTHHMSSTPLSDNWAHVRVWSKCRKLPGDWRARVKLEIYIYEVRRGGYWLLPQSEPWISAIIGNLTDAKPNFWERNLEGLLLAQ